MHSLIRRCLISLAGSDDKDTRIQQVSYNGKAQDGEAWAPYGMSYNVPPNSLSLYVQIGGDQGNLVILPDRSQDRVKNLKEGEVAFFNPLTKSRTIYRANGDMDITVNGDCNIKADEVNVDADQVNLGVGGDDIARVGDTVRTVIVSGSSAGTHDGTIITGGNNTST